MAEDKHSKKHPASAKKKKDLKKKGQTPKSQDIPMAMGLIAAFGALIAMKGLFLARMHDSMETYIGAIRYTSDIDINSLMMRALMDVAVLSAPVLFAVLSMAVVSNVAQTGLIITGHQLKPDLKKINPMTKFKQWFSIKSLQDLGKSLAKIVVASFLGWLVFKGSMDDIAGAVQIDSALGLMVLAATIIKKLFTYIIILYITVAIADFAFQRKNFEKDNKMTDKEVKDEYKNSEGDPYQKGKRRQMAQQILQQGAQDHVPQSDVVVINPTQYAIALKYDADVSPVPWIVAMGEVHDADAIRTSAKNAGIPVVRNKPLARALWQLCEVGDIVPEDLYRPVAEILAYVFGLQEQLAADANQAAEATLASSTPGAAPGTTDAAAAAHRLDHGDDDEGVHDLGVVQVPVIAAAAGAEAAGVQGQVPVVTAAGASMDGGWMLGGQANGGGAVTQAQPQPATHVAAATTTSDDDRFSWR